LPLSTNRGGLDKSCITWYTCYIMTTKNTENGKTQQLRNADEALWRRIKAAAVLEGETLTKWTEKAARERLDKKPK